MSELSIDPEQSMAVLIEATRITREKFINLARTPNRERDQLVEALGQFHDALQQEADLRYRDAFRDIWYNHEVTKAYRDAQSFDQALEAAEDGLIVATNLQNEQWITEFEQLIQEFDQKLKPA